MYIDPADNLFAKNPSADFSDQPIKKTGRNIPQSDQIIREEYNEYIKIAQNPPSNESRTLQARFELDSGTLDTPENALNAAQNILKFGI